MQFLKKIRRGDELLKHISWVFVATSLGSVFSLFYQLYMVRNLTPIEYGVLNSLVGLLMIISVPTGTLQTAITKFISTFHARHQWGKIRTFLFMLTKKVSIFGLIFFIIITLSSKRIASFLQMTEIAPVVAVGVIMLVTIIVPLTLGGLQGLQLFQSFGLSVVISGGLKLIMGIVLVSLGFKVMGALTAYIISSIAMFFLSFFPLKRYVARERKLSAVSVANNNNDESGKVEFKELYKYFIPVTIVLLCFMGLVNGDIILVKHFFSPLEAGFYSIAQMAGKIILFLPGAVTIVMFPKVSNLYAQKKSTLHVLKKSLVITGLLCGGASLFCILYPSFIIRILSGGEYSESIALVWLFSIAMLFFALAYNLVFYQLSIHRKNFIYPLVFFAVLQTVLFIIFHQTLSQVLYILCGIAVLLFITNLWLVKAEAVPGH